ncbi:MAG: hypothetical protein GF346_07380 [Candidatus Eisenbacteria bacterium]|nr:hypothetical protein [Candidatus Latescibacterota bacterium]MBD3302253.1 hypothetical protein [Candidatus Eisenbacteria bacterium]
MGREGQEMHPRTNRGGWRRLARYRFVLYGLAVIAILVIRFYPDSDQQSRPGEGDPEPSPPLEDHLVLSGLDLAPRLIPRVADVYRDLYPEHEIRIRPGGTRQALEDLLNRRANVAFLNRPLTAAEREIVRGVGDSALSFPIALGAIAVLARRDAPIDSLPIEDLRVWLAEKRAIGSRFADGGEVRFYAPDPNLGLWEAIREQLDLPPEVGEGVYWLASDRQVAQAVSKDPQGIGFASLLALEEDLDRLSVEAIRVPAMPESVAVPPQAMEVATGGYPLYHYLYAACRPAGGAVASGFVSFLYSGRGQRLVAREGFLPAREAPREILLTNQPLSVDG